LPSSLSCCCPESVEDEDEAAEAAFIDEVELLITRPCRGVCGRVAVVLVVGLVVV